MLSNPLPVTLLTMKKMTLVTKEERMYALQNRTHQIRPSHVSNRLMVTGAGSANDDFDQFRIKLKFGHRQDEEVKTYHFREISGEEFDLAKVRDSNYLQSFQIPPELHTNEAQQLFSRISSSRLTMFKQLEQRTVDPSVRSNESSINWTDVSNIHDSERRKRELFFVACVCLFMLFILSKNYKIQRR